MKISTFIIHIVVVVVLGLMAHGSHAFPLINKGGSDLGLMKRSPTHPLNNLRKRQTDRLVIASSPSTEAPLDTSSSGKKKEKKKDHGNNTTTITMKDKKKDKKNKNGNGNGNGNGKSQDNETEWV